LLEINSSSLNLVIHIIESLGLNCYIKNCFTADAITYFVPNPESFDILFSETVNAALYRESYVPILANLLAQLPKEITVIPQNVSLTISDPSENKSISTKTIFNTREAIKTIKNHTQLPKILPPYKIPLSAFNNLKFATIDTAVNVYNDLTLKKGNPPYPFLLSFN